jgi:hypothetical protein
MVDRFSKYTNFIPIRHSYTATTVVRYFTEIMRLLGLLSSIVSDRNAMFISSFKKELFCLSGVRLNMSMAFHPQTDGHSEAVNKIINIKYVDGVPHSDRRPIRSGEQDNHHVPQLLVQRSPSPVGALAAMGRILQQFCISELAADLAILRRLRPRSTSNSSIHTRFGSSTGRGPAAHGP